MKQSADAAERIASLKATAAGLREKLATAPESERWLLMRDLEATESRIRYLSKNGPLGAAPPPPARPWRHGSPRAWRRSIQLETEAPNVKTPDEFADAVRQRLVEEQGQTEQDAAATFEQNAPKLYERLSFAGDGELLVTLPTGQRVRAESALAAVTAEVFAAASSEYDPVKVGTEMGKQGKADNQNSRDQGWAFQ